MSVIAFDVCAAMSIVISVRVRHVRSCLRDIRGSGDGNAINLGRYGGWDLGYNAAWDAIEKLRYLFFGLVRPPIRIPVAYVPLFCSFPNHETNPAFIHSL